MALTVTEANAVNSLLRWTLSVPRVAGTVPNSAEAKAAAQLLADHANKTLMAGIRGTEVAEHWPEEGPF